MADNFREGVKVPTGYIRTNSISKDTLVDISDTLRKQYADSELDLVVPVYCLEKEQAIILSNLQKAIDKIKAYSYGEGHSILILTSGNISSSISLDKEEKTLFDTVVIDVERDLENN